MAARPGTAAKRKGGRQPRDPEFEKKHPRGRGGQGGQFVRSGSPQATLVKGVQRELGMTHASGTFNPQTVAAVKEFQRQNGLVVDGVVGTQTASALAAGAATGSKAGKVAPGELTASNTSFLRSRGKAVPTSKRKLREAKGGDCSSTGGAHVIDKSARARAEGGKGGTVRCKKCGKRLRLKPSGDSVKGAAREVSEAASKAEAPRDGSAADSHRNVKCPKCNLIQSATHKTCSRCGHDLASARRAKFANLEEAPLTSKARKALPSSSFVFPKDERYPIHDLDHARNALARSSGKPEEATVRAAVYKRYPQLKKDVGK